MKRNLLILVIILLIGFITNSCSDDENECSFCKNGQHCNTHCVIENCPVHDCKNHNKSACDVCNQKCKCPEDTIHFIGDIMQCASENNCNCEHGNFTGARASNGIAITNRYDVDLTDFTEIIDFIEDALIHTMLSTTKRDYIKNNIKEIKIVPLAGNPVFVEDGVLTIEPQNGDFVIMLTLKQWCEAKGIE